MKASQASIYRVTERLLEHSFGIVDRTPKNEAYRVMGERLLKNLYDSLDFIVLAFQSEDGQGKLNCINGLVLSMTSVKMTYRMLFRISEHQANAKGKSPIITKNQYSQAIDFILSISKQAGAWAKKQNFIESQKRSSI